MKSTLSTMWAIETRSEDSKANNSDLDLAGARCLLVASTGGHLAQLVRLASRWGVSENSLWITFETPQSQALLAGRKTFFVPYVRPRDWRAILTARRLVAANVDVSDYDHAVSTGSGLALAVLPAAAMRGVPTCYVESVSRVQGPSLTGRVLARVPRVQTRTQHPGWASRRWRPIESVMSTYHAEIVRPAVDKPRLFVTLGTIEKYRFDGLIEAVLASGLADDTTVWQIGCNARSDLPGTVIDQVPSAEFDALARAADVVISHAGVGCIMRMFELGIFPLVAPRRAQSKEHVDDHQLEIAGHVRRNGLGLVVDHPKEINLDMIKEASRRAVRKSDQYPATGDPRTI
jgi:UDP-N-acetylglucosamine transferase subunit ALG13